MEVGGKGECGWRAAALMIGLQNNNTADLEAIIDKLEILSSSLRVRTMASYAIALRDYKITRKT